jgi:hypothetical protein
MFTSHLPLLRKVVSTAPLARSRDPPPKVHRCRPNVSTELREAQSQRDGWRFWIYKPARRRVKAVPWPCVLLRLLADEPTICLDLAAKPDLIWYIRLPMPDRNRGTFFILRPERLQSRRTAPSLVSLDQFHYTAAAVRRGCCSCQLAVRDADAKDVQIQRQSPRAVRNGNAEFDRSAVVSFWRSVGTWPHI